MAYAESLEAIVLQAHNVGEADRFCILFTKERGRLAARARAVRKLTSKMGGSLLPLSHVKIELKESSGGNIAAGAVRIGDDPSKLSVRSFLTAMQGVEWLLSMLHDEEPLPEIFELTKKFLGECQEDRDRILPFSISLLQHMGMLPRDAGNPAFGSLNGAFVEACAGDWMQLPELSPLEKNQLTDMTLKVAEGHSSRVPRSFVSV